MPLLRRRQGEPRDDGRARRDGAGSEEFRSVREGKCGEVVGATLVSPSPVSLRSRQPDRARQVSPLRAAHVIVGISPQPPKWYSVQTIPIAAEAAHDR